MSTDVDSQGFEQRLKEIFAEKGLEGHVVEQICAEAVQSLMISMAQIDQSSEQALGQSLKRFFAGQNISSTAIDVLCARTAHEHFKIVASDPSLPIKLPNPGEIPLYAERPDKSVNALAFYEAHWKCYTDAGLLYRHILRQFDHQLMAALGSYCQAHKLDRNTVLPPKKSDFIDAEIAATGLSDADIHRFSRHITRRRGRAKAAAADPPPASEA